MSLAIKAVNNRRDLSRFIRLPNRLHRHHPAWVAPLISEVKESLTPKKNPFFEHAEMQLFLAVEGGKTVGRIAGIIDRNFIETQGKNVGSFGFFESVDNPRVAAALFDEVSRWLMQRKMDTMLGPANPSMNDELGVLQDAFDLPPAIKMIWNPSYYPGLYESAGFTKAMDLWAWTVSAQEVSGRLLQVGARIVKRTRAEFRHVNLKNFNSEVDLFRGIYNQAWSGNWGFVPWTRAEFGHVAKSLKQVIDPNLVLIAEVDGRPVGFSLALPDLNLALKHINGRLFPFGLPILLWHARKIDRARVLILGVLEEYRGRGIDTALYYEMFRSGTQNGYNSAELSWVLENNNLMNRALEMLGASRYKTYRLYERPL